ncbi:hypothetical protein DKX38_024572 [Salix brachista]|uniref:Uncharacterized protein n=1 Tax=Salix brachista TaxID=2182728 RepID=A0A5N5JSC6_9ROSI|nr:hypothetical protein DKX38_024572 [Salix brachista]
MAEEGKSDAQLFQLLSDLLHQVVLWREACFISPSLSMAALSLPPAAEKFLALKFTSKDQLFLLKLTDQKVEAQSNEEEVELRSKIEALGLEVAKLPSKSTNNLDELEIARELDKLSAKLDDVDEMISSALASDPQVQSLLSDTADVWMPVITANADERRNFTASVGNGISLVPEGQVSSLDYQIEQKYLAARSSSSLNGASSLDIIPPDFSLLESPSEGLEFEANKYQRALGKQPQMITTKIQMGEELKELETKDFISLINANDSKKCANLCPKGKNGKAFDLNKKPPEKDCHIASSSNHRESNKDELPLSKDNLDLTLRLCSVHALP